MNGYESTTSIGGGAKSKLNSFYQKIKDPKSASIRLILEK